MSSKKIIVPVDYSASTIVAVEHGYNIAQHVDAHIELLHFVDSPGDVAAGETELDLFIQGVKKDIGEAVEFRRSVLVGDFLTDIGERAEDTDTMLVVMGTHGVKGLQFVTGSHALKIVSSTHIPFIIVQERGIGENGYENIIAPLDLHAETKQKLDIVGRMARYFDSKVHLVIPNETDEFLHNTLQRNLNYSEEYFEGIKVPFSATVAEEDDDDMEVAIEKCAKAKNGDLIAVMNWDQPGILGLFGDKRTSKIINNEDMIPVLVLNPRSISDFDLFAWPQP